MSPEAFREWRGIPATKEVFARMKDAQLRIADQALNAEGEGNRRYAVGFRDAVAMLADPEALEVEVVDE